MKPQAARQLTKDVFNQEFSPDRFRRLAKNIFSDLSVSDGVLENTALPAQYQEHIESIEKVGEHEDSTGNRTDVLIIYLKKDSKLQRARTMQRNVAAWYLGQTSATKHKDATLAAYVPPSKEEWRFSFVKMQHTLKSTETGVKTETKLTPARRKSFPVGGHGNTYTAQDQIIPLLKSDNVTLKDLETAFDIEVVTEEFYEGVARLFVKLVGGTYGTGAGAEEFPGILELPSVKRGSETMQQFGVRLIGRVIFCWFLREKKSKDGVPLVPEEILSKDALEGQESYYHEVLAPLFFEALNTPIEEREGAYRTDAFSRVPYLNGGLFRPQKDADFYRPDNQALKNALKVPDSWLEDFFTLLERYHFTIDESTSVDVDLSIDPEMLGKVFEQLLAYIDPDAKDSVYTPREIVDYMVDESLAEHLQTKADIAEEKIRALISYDLSDDAEFPLEDAEKDAVVNALKEVTILDPACGSGAFPIGALQKITFMLEQIDPEAERWFDAQIEGADPLLQREFKKYKEENNYSLMRKQAVIRNSIFGVDIQPIATEISRLRCFLTLIVDEKIDEGKDNRGIIPLPNLEFKFVTANTLIQPPKQSGEGKTEQLMFESFEDRLEEAVSDYYSASHPDKKLEYTNNLRDLIEEKSSKMQSHVISDSGIHTGKKYEDAYREMKRTSQSSMIKEAQMWKSYLNVFKNEPVDFFEIKYFFPRARDGFDIVIGNPPYAQILKGTVDENVFPYSEGKDSGKQNMYKVFVEAGYNFLKENGVLSYITQSSILCDKSATHSRELLLTQTDMKEVVEFPKDDRNTKGKIFESVTQGTSIIIFKKAKPSDESEFLIAVNTDKESLHSGERAVLNQGELMNFYPQSYSISLVSPGEFGLLRKIKSAGPKTMSDFIVEISNGDFNVTTDKDKYSKEKTKIKMYRGKHVQRYDLKQNTNSFMDEDFLLDSVGKNKEFQYILTQGITGMTDKRRLISCFSRPTEKFLCGDSVKKYRLRDEKINKFFLGLVNSKLLDWVFRKTSTNNNVNSYEIEELPIPILDSSDVIFKKIDKSVSNLLDKKQAGEDTAELEADIDELVMDLYELTEDEKAIIRNS